MNPLGSTSSPDEHVPGGNSKRCPVLSNKQSQVVQVKRLALTVHDNNKIFLFNSPICNHAVSFERSEHAAVWRAISMRCIMSDDRHYSTRAMYKWTEDLKRLTIWDTRSLFLYNGYWSWVLSINLQYWTGLSFSGYLWVCEEKELLVWTDELVPGPFLMCTGNC